MRSQSQRVPVIAKAISVRLRQVVPFQAKPLSRTMTLCEGAGKPVDLVDDDNIDLAAADVGQQSLQRRALGRAAGRRA
jgi:hypothetical protein